MDIPVHETGNKKLSDSLEGDGRTRAELEVLISRPQGTNVFWGTGGWRIVKRFAPPIEVNVLGIITTSQKSGYRAEKRIAEDE